MVDYKTDVDFHCYEIEKCNQRGGRMLTVVDLIKRGTLTITQASFLMEEISKGSSFIVGAKPGGAGKTTVMCALLNFLPPGIKIIPAENMEILEKGKNREKSCFLCHEIGKGPYYAYLWGEELLKFFELKKYGHIIVSNLHADTLNEAKIQITRQNPVPEELFNSVELYIFLKVERKGWEYSRKIDKIWKREKGKYVEFVEGNFRPERKYIDFIKSTVSEDIFIMRDFRKAFVEFFLQNLKGEEDALKS
ncbi:hypothetical protein J7L87_01375 [bacterium]|nr:hypothetical protein [bacterium]